MSPRHASLHHAFAPDVRPPEVASPAVPGDVWTLHLSGRGDAPVAVDRRREVVVGSASDDDVVVEDDQVRPHQLRVRVDDGRLHVRDASGARLLVGSGAEASELWFSHGASFVVGSTLVRCARGLDLQPTTREAPLAGVCGSSQVMRRLARDVRRIADLSAPVVLSGETGSGKDVVANALHRESRRRHQPFLPINVSTLGRELAEAELFGHERGAYTGAERGKPGAFVSADLGTLFLDEIGDLALDLQAKLLRTLESGEVRAVGSCLPRRVDVRVVSASWRSIDDLVAAGAFRDDLRHRLAVFTLHVPPLRERLEDLPELATHLLGQLARDVGERVLAGPALAYLGEHAFPGNVRELRNVLTRAAAWSTGRRIGVAEVTRALPKRVPVPGRGLAYDRRDEVVEAVHACGGNLSAAARHLGVARSTVRFWMRRAPAPLAHCGPAAAAE